MKTSNLLFVLFVVLCTLTVGCTMFKGQFNSREVVGFGERGIKIMSDIGPLELYIDDTLIVKDLGPSRPVLFIEKWDNTNALKITCKSAGDEILPPFSSLVPGEKRELSEEPRTVCLRVTTERKIVAMRE